MRRVQQNCKASSREVDSTQRCPGSQESKQPGSGVAVKGIRSSGPQRRSGQQVQQTQPKVEPNADCLLSPGDIGVPSLGLVLSCALRRGVGLELAEVLLLHLAACMV